jgi:hypothetical protein
MDYMTLYPRRKISSGYEYFQDNAGANIIINLTLIPCAAFDE